MRVRGYSGSSSLPLDTSQCFLLSRLLTYTDRLLARSPRLDFELLQIIHWVLGPEIAEEDLLPLVAMVDGGQRYRRYDREMDYDIRHSRDFANVIDENLRKASKDLHVCVIDLLRGVMKKRLDQLRHRGMSDVEKGLSQFQQMFDPREEVHKAVQLSLEAHLSLVAGGRKPVRASAMDTDGFTLDGLNVSGADLPGLLKELESFSEYLKHSPNDRPLSMSLLFHGISGSGKSHMARFIAHHLDREILVKRASDLLSSWVGETEQNIRDAFDEAAEKEAVLLFDEADFALGSRDRAVRSWEISQINEILTAMESFRGIQIYTTNRLTDLDPATLRRFNHKIEFHCLKPEGVVLFYRKLLVPLVGSDPDKKLESELKGISGLTPGDFKVVRDKSQFKAPEARTHESMIAALREEARVKEVHAGKKAIGF